MKCGISLKDLKARRAFVHPKKLLVQEVVKDANFLALESSQHCLSSAKIIDIEKVLELDLRNLRSKVQSKPSEPFAPSKCFPLFTKSVLSEPVLPRQHR